MFVYRQILLVSAEICYLFAVFSFVVVFNVCFSFSVSGLFFSDC